MKEKKGRLYKFYGKLTIRNKLLISCLPFVILGYFLIFYSTTVIMFDQMKQMVYDQTEQNVMEKKKLVNTLLDNYNQATIKFLYYTDEVQEYLNTRQSVLSVEEQEKLTDMISYQIGSLITNNQDALMNVCIYNKFNELYINNAIYYNTIEQTNDFAEILKEAAEEKHGKPVLRINPVRKNMITFARNIYVPQIEKSDEKIGFLMMDIDKTGMEKIIQTGEDRDVNAILILDSENNILVNGSNLSNVSVTVKGCLTITFKVSSPKYSSNAFPLTVIFPFPLIILTLAIELFLLPVPLKTTCSFFVLGIFYLPPN